MLIGFSIINHPFWGRKHPYVQRFGIGIPMPLLVSVYINLEDLKKSLFRIKDQPHPRQANNEHDVEIYFVDL